MTQNGQADERRNACWNRLSLIVMAVVFGILVSANVFLSLVFSGFLSDTTLTDPQRNTMVADEDNDGCTDAQELGLDETLGGRRDYLNFWDFFDPNRDRAVTLLDFLAMLARFGAVGDANIDPLSDPPPPPAYHTRFDRTGASPGANPWESGPPDGIIAIGDFLALLTQFGHTCA